MIDKLELKSVNEEEIENKSENQIGDINDMKAEVENQAFETDEVEEDSEENEGIAVEKTEVVSTEEAADSHVFDTLESQVQEKKEETPIETQAEEEDDLDQLEPIEKETE